MGRKKRRILSLFTGAGGLDLGLEAAGFNTSLCVELDGDAQSTLRHNKPEWHIAQQSDAIQFAKDPIAALKKAGLKRSEITMIAGGPPCQPFSKAGNWTHDGPKRMKDPRAQTLRAYVRIVAAVRPKVLLLENVAGFARDGRSDAIDSLDRGLRAINRAHNTCYRFQIIRINAADFGVPQLRERVFLIAHREGRLLETPAPQFGPNSESQAPYRTAWDSIGDLQRRRVNGEYALKGKWADLLPSIPEGKNYLWHTPGSGGRPLFGHRTKFWSFLLKLAKDLPSWTISATPGPATGPFHWNGRLLTERELCRLQTFPDNFVVTGSQRAVQRQIGNAVPPAIGEMLGLAIRRQLLGEKLVRTTATFLPPKRRQTPAPEKIKTVRRKYLTLLGNHRPHPGVGLGPARKHQRKNSR